MAKPTLEEYKSQIRDIGRKYTDREQRSRRIFVEERAASLSEDREREFSIKTEISSFFSIPYSSVRFCGSAQLGFSVHKDRLFDPLESDLDVACIDAGTFNVAWTDVLKATRAMTDLTPFGNRNQQSIDTFKDQLVRRAMIRVRAMPNSPLKSKWRSFEDSLKIKYSDLFSDISFAFYSSEYAFCWKQDSVVSTLMRP